MEGIDAEVIVVDNASNDGSVELIQSKFPSVILLVNKKNIGFGKANNLALQKARGECVLFLNPDTLVAEDCFERCIQFLNNHGEAGALGIRMIDGSGRFLPESKRAFPSLSTSFYKLSGLTRLFPKSKVFAKYHLGFLNELENHEVDVLSGAFLMARGELIKDLGGFDESFFMYGEDIDLSYRIQKAGFKNYYFAESTIIHFKGESTKKGNINYVKMFYQAMSIFVDKHYASGNAKMFSILVKVAIWFRALLTTIFNVLLKIGMPLLDTIIIVSSFYLVKDLWVAYARDGQSFTPILINISLPGFTLIFLTAASFAGMYDNRYKPSKAFYAALVSIMVMLAMYSLLAERYRFSRGVILLGGIVAALFITVFRWILVKTGMVEVYNKYPKTVVVGTTAEYKKAMELLFKVSRDEKVIGRISVNEDVDHAIGPLSQLNNLISALSIKEVLFCKGQLTYKAIIHQVQLLPKGISARFHGQKSISIIGSDSKTTSGESLSEDSNFAIAQPYHKRMKKVVDILTSLIILITFPVQIVFGPNILKNAVLVLIGKRTWVSYSSLNRLPYLPKGVLNTVGLNRDELLAYNKESLSKIDYWYAKEYKWLLDVRLITRHWKQLANPS